jgi:hypothetical protein
MIREETHKEEDKELLKKQMADFSAYLADERESERRDEAMRKKWLRDDIARVLNGRKLVLMPPNNVE